MKNKIIILFFILAFSSGLCFAENKTDKSNENKSVEYVSAKQVKINNLLTDATDLYIETVSEKDINKQKELLEKIEKIYPQIIELDPENEISYIGLGNVYNDLAVISTQDTPDTQDTQETKDTKDKKNKEKTSTLFETALSYYKKADEVKPKKPETLFLLGLIEYKLYKYQVDKVNKIKKLELALNYFKNSNLILAQEHVGVTIIQSSYLLAILEDDLLKKKKHIDDGLKTFNNYFTEETQNPMALLNAALLYDLTAHLEEDLTIKNVSFDKALSLIDKQIALNNSIPFSYYERAQTIRSIANLEQDKKRKGELLENALNSIKSGMNLLKQNSSYASLGALIASEKSLIVTEKKELLEDYAKNNWENAEKTLVGSSLYEKAIWAAQNNNLEEAKKLLLEIKKIEKEKNITDLLRPFDYAKNEKAFKSFLKEDWFLKLWQE